jgi:hypothetical protein
LRPRSKGRRLSRSTKISLELLWRYDSSIPTYFVIFDGISQQAQLFRNWEYAEKTAHQQQEYIESIAHKAKEDEIRAERLEK